MGSKADFRRGLIGRQQVVALADQVRCLIAFERHDVFDGPGRNLMHQSARASAQIIPCMVWREALVAPLPRRRPSPANV